MMWGVGTLAQIGTQDFTGRRESFDCPEDGSKERAAGGMVADKGEMCQAREELNP